MGTIKKLLDHLKQNWIRYGFETFTIVVGIFGAFTIESWSDTRQQQKNDIDFLRNLRDEIVLDTSIISRQRIRLTGLNNRIEKTLYYFDNNPDLSQSEYKLIGSTIISLEQLIPVQQNVLRNEQMISYLGYAYGVTDDQYKAQEIINELIEESNAVYVPTIAYALIYAGLGDNDKAISWLEKSYSERTSLLIDIKIAAEYDPLRSDQRFIELVKKMNFE